MDSTKKCIWGSPCFGRGTLKWRPKELENFFIMVLQTFEELLLLVTQLFWKCMKQVSRNRAMSYSMKQFHETPKISWNMFFGRTHHETFVWNTVYHTKVSSCVPDYKLKILTTFSSSRRCRLENKTCQLSAQTRTQTQVSGFQSRCHNLEAKGPDMLTGQLCILYTYIHYTLLALLCHQSLKITSKWWCKTTCVLSNKVFLH